MAVLNNKQKWAIKDIDKHWGRMSQGVDAWVIPMLEEAWIQGFEYAKYLLETGEQE